jgi:hypothetical protein
VGRQTGVARRHRKPKGGSEMPVQRGEERGREMGWYSGREKVEVCAVVQYWAKRRRRFACCCSRGCPSFERAGFEAAAR